MYAENHAILQHCCPSAALKVLTTWLSSIFCVYRLVCDAWCTHFNRSEISPVTSHISLQEDSYLMEKTASKHFISPSSSLLAWWRERFLRWTLLSLSSNKFTLLWRRSNGGEVSLSVNHVHRPKIDQKWISACIINKFPSRKMPRIKKNINWRKVFDLIP